MSDANTAPELDLETLSDEEMLNHTSTMYPTPSQEEPEEVEFEHPAGVLEDRLTGPADITEDSDDADLNDEQDEAVVTEPENDQDDDDDGQESESEANGDEPEAKDDAETKDEETTPADAAGSDADHTTPKQTTPAKDAPTAGSKTEAKDAALNYEQLYKQIMAPFKANGRDFTPSSPDEAVRLMQMGANYTKKMQAIKPNLKMLRMLDNNGLLDEDKLAFLIDLDKKNPEAIQKLLHEGKIDPMDLDTSSEPTYKPGNHSVTDAEVDFHDAIENVSQTPTGKATIKHIDSEWDATSKQAVFREPALLGIIDEQRANGIYDRISAEVDRRRTLGELTNVPFIQAYKTVGDELHAQGKLAPAGGSAVQPTPTQPVVQTQAIETRPTKKRTPNASREQVRAVSSAPGSKSKSAKPSFNPLMMSDEEIAAIPTPF